jgi:cell division protein FtsX
MAVPGRPWFRYGPIAGPRGAALWLLWAAWVAGGLALWAGLSARGWLVARRPQLAIEAFIAPSATAAQTESFGQAVQVLPWCCGFRYVSAEDARLEAGRDDRVRSLLEAYGANPFLRSFRVTLCPGTMEFWHEAADWMKRQPGIASVRAPSVQAPRLLETERLVLAIARAGAWGLGGFALLAAAFALGALAGNLRRELRVYAELGATSMGILRRALWALVVPSVFIAALVVVGMELVNVLGRLGGVWAAGPLQPLPDFPHEAGGGLLAAAVVLPGLAAAVAAAMRRQ